LVVDLKYTQASTNTFEVEGSAFDGKKVPAFKTFPEVPGRETAVLLVGASMTSAAEPWSCAKPGDPAPAPMPIIDVTRFLTLVVPVTFAEVAKTLVVRKLLENQALPPRVRFAVAPALMPMLDVTERAPTFVDPVRFAEVVKTLVVRKLLENQAFPPTVRFAVAAAPMPMFDVTERAPRFAVPVTFVEVAKTPGVRKLLENQAFPPTSRYPDWPKTD